MKSAPGHDLPAPRNPAGAALWWAGAAAILAAAAALRFQGLGRLEMWSDECHSVITATSPRGVLAELRTDSNAPLYFILLRAWIAVTGSIEAEAVRALSATAGLLTVGACGAWACALRLGRPAALWAMGLCAVATLQVYYSQEARGYALCFLLVSLAGAALVAALTRPRAWPWWIVHAATMALACLTHDLCVAFFPASWVGAWALGARRRHWCMLAAAHAAALIIYSPQLATVLTQPKGPALAWIEPLWRAIPPALAIPRSIEALGVGAATPPYIRLIPPGAAGRAASIAWLAACAAGVVLAWRAARSPSASTNDAPPLTSTRGAILYLAAWIAAPVLLQYAYSLVAQPIYVVGRYDTLGQPAFLVLMGLGTWELQRRAMERRALAGAVLPVAIVIVLTASGLRQRAIPMDDPVRFRPLEVRSAILSHNARQDDIIVCFGLEGVKVAYAMLRRDVPAALATFPLSTRSHMGWFHPESALAAGRAALEADARRLAAGLVSAQPEYRRMWVAVDPYYTRTPPPGATNPHAEIAAIFFDTIREAGLTPAAIPDAADQALADQVGLLLFEPAAAR